MKIKISNKILPKVTLILKEDGKDKYLYPSIRKTQFFIKNKADSYLKNDNFITIRVAYKNGAENAGTYNTIEELSWAFKVFVTEYLND